MKWTISGRELTWFRDAGGAFSVRRPPRPRQRTRMWTMTTSRTSDWRDRGSYFSWQPTTTDAAAVDIFHVELGDPAAPVLLLLHGWPTSSIDWYAVAIELSAKFRVCALDFPGYGLSAKPPGWGYSLARDAELADYYLAEVV